MSYVAAALALALGVASGVVVAQRPSESSIAIVGATLIDGSGGAPAPNTTVLITGNRISEVGASASVRVPSDAVVIDGRNRFITPGFVDTNVHISLYGAGSHDRYETAVRYQPRAADLTLEGAQLHLKYGVTTVRDSYGALLPLIQVRDAIARGSSIGPRILAAGNIVGWGGPYSITFAGTNESGLSLWQEEFNDWITQGAGEELMDLTPDELRVAINTYLDKGPDFIKYGGTSHLSYPSQIGFSLDAQRAMVEEIHKRGLVAEVHSTNPEGLRLSLLAGIDLIQHPEAYGDHYAKEMPDEVIRLILERKVICSMLINTVTGSAWQRHLKQVAEADRKAAEADTPVKPPRTAAEKRRHARARDVGIAGRRRNAEKLIKAGVIVTLGTDNYAGSAPEFRREPKQESQEPGLGTIIAIEGLVELGMTPLQAIVAATKNGALASKGLEQFGTVERGKLADVLVLDADPLADISNIRKLHTLIRDGRVVNISELPTSPVFYKRPSSELKTSGSQPLE